MPGSSLPTCVQYIQALGFPVVGSIIAVIGAWIAWQQMHIARVKLQHDVYERRFAIFSVARELLAAIVINGVPLPQDIAKFTVGTVGAAFHFDQPTLDYLEEISLLASALLVDEQTIAGMPNGDPAVEKRVRDNRRWLQDQIQRKELTKRFLPYLALDPATRL